MKESEFDYLVPKKNWETEAKHKREVLLQITLPLILGLILLAAVCVLPVVAVTGGGEVVVWRDISLIWLIAPTLIFLVIVLAVSGGLAYGVIRLIGVLPGFFFKVQEIFTKVQVRTSAVSNRVTRPFIKIGSTTARIKAVKTVVEPVPKG